MNVIPFPMSKRPILAGSVERQGTHLLLPVAPRASARIRFAASDFESDRVLLPENVPTLLKQMIAEGNPPGEIILAGPGDPLAAPHQTCKTLEKIRGCCRDLSIRMLTLGMGMEHHAEKMARKGLGKITLLVDAVAEEVAARLYAWIRPGTRTIPLSRAIPVLLEEQQQAVSLCLQNGIEVTIRTTVYPGYNDEHIEKIAGKMAALGAANMEIVPFQKHSEIDLQDADDRLMESVLNQVHGYIPDAAILHEDAIKGQTATGSSCQSSCGENRPGAPPLTAPRRERPNTAVTSSNGMDIDLHLGQAREVLIYGPREDGLTCLLERRRLPEPGGGERRWQDLGEMLEDCFALLTAGAGDTPRRVLAGSGITVLISEDGTEGTVDALYGGGRKRKKK